MIEVHGIIEGATYVAGLPAPYEHILGMLADNVDVKGRVLDVLEFLKVTVGYDADLLSERLAQHLLEVLNLMGVVRQAEFTVEEIKRILIL